MDYDKEGKVTTDDIAKRANTLAKYSSRHLEDVTGGELTEAVCLLVMTQTQQIEQLQGIQHELIGIQNKLDQLAANIWAR